MCGPKQFPPLLSPPPPNLPPPPVSPGPVANLREEGDQFLWGSPELWEEPCSFYKVQYEVKRVPQQASCQAPPGKEVGPPHRGSWRPSTQGSLLTLIPGQGHGENTHLYCSNKAGTLSPTGRHKGGECGWR